MKKHFTLIELLVVIAMMAITTRSSIRVNFLFFILFFLHVLRLKKRLDNDKFCVLISFILMMNERYFILSNKLNLSRMVVSDHRK